MTGRRIMIIGAFTPASMGRYLSQAAQGFGLRVVEVQDREAFARSGLVQAAYQRLLRPEPMRLRSFGASVVERARREGVSLCVATGHAPLDDAALTGLKALGVTLINYATDDPWNLRNRCGWRLPTLGRYDAIFTPRPANLDQLRATGCPRVELLSFGFDPATHRPADADELAAEVRTADVVFIGGADADRLPYIRALARTGLKLRLYGGFWGRHRDLRRDYGGQLSASGMRSVLARAKVSVCLVRRSNRDEHVMRTYEEPAMGSCVLMEDTPMHGALFGDRTAAACFFSTPDELAHRAQVLCADPELRAFVRDRERAAVVTPENTYASRLKTMLEPTGLLDAG